MPTPSALPVIEFFTENPNETFKIVYVLDIDIQNEPYEFRVIFKNLSTGKYNTVLISAELLRSKYRVGYLYCNGRRIYSHDAVSKTILTVDPKPDDKLVQLSTLLDEHDIFPEETPYFGKYLLKQYVFMIEYEECIAIIPCYTVALRFYFLSSSMKNAVMDGSLDSLYYRYFPIVDSELKLHIKKRAGKKDLPFIGRFLSNPYTMNRLKYFSAQRSKAYIPLQPIRAHFPIVGEYELSVTYRILDSSRYTKPILFVMSIDNDTSPLGFDKLLYKQFSSKVNPSDIDSTQMRMPSKNRFKKRKLYKQDQIIRHGIPSSSNDHEIIFEITQKDLNTLGLEIHGETVHQPSDAKMDIEYMHQKGSISMSGGNSSGDESLTHGIYIETEHERENKVFRLDDFFQFYDELVGWQGVEEIIEAQIGEINVIKNNKRNTINSKSINNLTNTNRRFLFACFAYDNKCIHIVEVEHDESWGPSTWLFVSEDIDIQYMMSDMQEILEHYIEKSMKYEELKEYVLDKYQLLFLQKSHRAEQIDTVAIENWCELVLEKILDLK